LLEKEKQLTLNSDLDLWYGWTYGMASSCLFDKQIRLFSPLDICSKISI